MPKWLGLAILFLVIAAPGWSATIYLDKSISNCASTYNPATRLCSGGSAISWNDFAADMDTIMNPGDTVEIRAGTYTQGVQAMPTCTAALPCVIRSYQNEDVTIRPSAGSGFSGQGVSFRRSSSVGAAYITVSGAGTDDGKHITFDFDLTTSAGLVYYTLANNITVTNVVVRDTPTNSCVDWWHAGNHDNKFLNSTVTNCGDTPGQDHAIYVRGSDNLVSGNTVSNTVGGCVHLWESTDSSHRNVIEKNDLSDCDAYGILMGSGQGNIARFNVIHNYATFGIRIGDNNPFDNLVYNNTLYNSVLQGSGVVACIENKASATRTVIKNNICQGGATANSEDIDNLASTGTVSNNTTDGTAAFKNAPTDFSLTTNIAGTSSIVSSITGTTLTATVSISCNGTCSQGAHNSPVFSSCSVENGDATKLRVVFTTATTMQGSAAANWAAVVAGAGVSESAVTFVSTTRVDITIPAVTSGQTVTIAYTAPASSALSDTLAIGGTRNSAVRSFTAEGCTNRVDAALVVTFEQIHSRWGAFYSLSESTEISLELRGCGEDDDCTFDAYSRFILRLKMRCNGDDCDPKAVALQYSLEGGAYTDIPSVPGADAIAYYACPFIPHLTPTTEQLTSGAGAFVAGQVISAPVELPVVDLAEDGETEFAYCLGFSGATVTDTYDFRLESLDTYTQTPRATIGYGGTTIKP